MNKYKYTVELTVEVEAFDESDAWDLIQEVIGHGELTSNVNVVDCEYHANDTPK